MKNISRKYFEGNASAEEQRKLLEWLQIKENRSAYNSYKTEWRNSLKDGRFPGGGEESWNRLQAKLWQKGYTKWQANRHVFLLAQVAAVFFFILSIGSVAYLILREPRPIPEIYSSVITANGQISKVELPDGSSIWLNSGSEIAYSNLFATSNRNVKLTGEAYFDVASEALLPMIIDCGDVKVKVVGTRFNVNAYNTEPSIQVTLEDGEIALLHSATDETFYKQKPGERVQVDMKNNKFSVDIVNTARYTSWKDGIIHIYNLPLEHLVKQLEKRYNQKFELTPEVSQIKYTFTIQNETLDEVIRLIEKITPVKAEQVENVIILKGDKTKMRKTDR